MADNVAGLYACAKCATLMNLMLIMPSFCPACGTALKAMPKAMPKETPPKEEPKAKEPELLSFARVRSIAHTLTFSSIDPSLQEWLHDKTLTVELDNDDDDKTKPAKKVVTMRWCARPQCNHSFSVRSTSDGTIVVHLPSPPSSASSSSNKPIDVSSVERDAFVSGMHAVVAAYKAAGSPQSKSVGTSSVTTLIAS